MHKKVKKEPKEKKKKKDKPKRERIGLLSTITSKVYLLFIVMLVSLIALQGISFLSMQKNIETVEEMQSKSLKILMQSQSLKLCVLEVQQALTNIGATRSVEDMDEGFARAEENAKLFSDTIKEVSESNPLRAQELIIIQQTFNAFHKVGKDMANSYVTGGSEAGNPSMGRFDEYANTINTRVDTFKVNAEKEMQESISSMKESTDNFRKISLYSFALVVIISFILVFSIVLPLRKNMKNLLTYIEQLAKGDFSVSLKKIPGGEIGSVARMVSHMCDNIRQLIIEAKDSAVIVKDTSNHLTQITKHTSASANEIAFSIESIADKAGKQTESTEFGVSKVFEIAQNIDSISMAVSQMNEIVERTNEMTSKGLNTVNNLTDINDKYMQSSAKLNNSVVEVASDIEKIHNITDAITEISQQTNLLALNASIEAARAGEHGRGFSVVADEIRKLSDQTNAAVNQVKDIIETIQTKSNSSVQAIKESEKLVEEQNTSIKDTLEIFNDIMDASQTLLVKADDVGKQSFDTAHKKDDILDTMRNVSNMALTTSSSTQEALASVEEQLTTTEEVVEKAHNLEDLSQSLLNTVERFKIS